MGIKHAAFLFLLAAGQLMSLAQVLPPEKHGGNYNITFDILTPEDGFGYHPVQYDYTKFSPQYTPLTDIPIEGNGLQRMCMVRDGANAFGFENWLSKVNRMEANMRTRFETYHLPVVVHVIHSSPTENISDAQVMSQIKVLNDDFSRLNLDTSRTRKDFRQYVMGARIHFNMATVTPDGKPTNGIDRVSMFGAPFTQNFIDAMIKPNTTWDPNRYLNIWVMNLVLPNGYPMLGYSQFPDAPKIEGIPDSVGDLVTDGVVINYRCFGTIGTATFPYNKGRTTTHEIGHWLGLRHVWGNTETCGAPDATDFCDDTPPVGGPNYYGLVEKKGCNGQIAMVENFMDYTIDSCMNSFTRDQVTRMRNVLVSSPRRATLLQSTVWKTNPFSTASTSTDSLGFCGDPVSLPVCVNFNANSSTCSDTSFIHNPDSDLGWKIEQGRACIRNYENLRRNSTDWLVLPPVDMSDTTKQYVLSFDVAYQMYNKLYADSLVVAVALDCDSEFETVYFKGGSRLATVQTPGTSAFAPALPSDWRKEAIDLSDFAGEGSVQVAFLNISGYGNNLYLDNISIAKK